MILGKTSFTSTVPCLRIRAFGFVYVSFHPPFPTDVLNLRKLFPSPNRSVNFPPPRDTFPLSPPGNQTLFSSLGGFLVENSLFGPIVSLLHTIFRSTGAWFPKCLSLFSQVCWTALEATMAWIKPKFSFFTVFLSRPISSFGIWRPKSFNCQFLCLSPFEYIKSTPSRVCHPCSRSQFFGGCMAPSQKDTVFSLPLELLLFWRSSLPPTPTTPLLWRCLKKTDGFFCIDRFFTIPSPIFTVSSFVFSFKKLFFEPTLMLIRSAPS